MTFVMDQYQQIIKNGTVEELIKAIRENDRHNLHDILWHLMKSRRMKMLITIMQEFNFDIDSDSGYLHSAYKEIIRNGSVYEFRDALENGAIWDHKNLHSFLREAICDGKVELVKMILEELDVDINNSDHDFVGLCSLYGNLEILKLLISHGANFCPERIFRNMAVYGHYDCTKFLLELGVSPNVAQGEPLVHNCRAGRYQFVKLLLEYGADIHIKEGSALIVAVEYGHYDIVQLLLDHGADTNAFDYLKSPQYKNCEKVYQLLTSYGVDPLLITKVYYYKQIVEN